jgi:hypothetical protein
MTKRCYGNIWAILVNSMWLALAIRSCLPLVRSRFFAANLTKNGSNLTCGVVAEPRTSYFASHAFGCPRSRISKRGKRTIVAMMDNNYY